MNAFTKRSGQVIWWFVLTGLVAWVAPRPSGTETAEAQAAVSVTVMAPNGGEVLHPDSLFNIQWTTMGSVDHVGIFLSLDGGMTYPFTIAHPAPNTGSFTWKVPEVESKQARVKVQAMDMNHKVLAEDASNNNFAITEDENDEDETEVHDVAMVSFTASPNPVSRGSFIVFSASAQNLGTKKEEQAMFQIVTGNAVLFGPVRIKHWMPGQVISGDIRIFVPRNAAPGNYIVTAQLLPVHDEVNLANNSLSVTVTVQ